MGRPKPSRRPSRRALARRARKAFRRSSLQFVQFGSEADGFIRVQREFVPVVTNSTALGSGSGSGGFVQISSTLTTNVSGAVSFGGAMSAGGSVTISGGTGVRDFLAPRQMAIESLDEGLTWHTADTLEPVVRVNDQLVIGSNPSGPAPDCMVAGSGTYRFEIPVRGATDDEIRAWQAGRETRERDKEERAAKAYARARELLLSHLTSSQRQDLEARGGFWVRSQFGNRYWVTRGAAVRFDDRGVALQRYCIHAVDAEIPPDDNALARMLLLRCDEEKFLCTANPGQPSEWDIASEPRRLAINDAADVCWRQTLQQAVAELYEPPPEREPGTALVLAGLEPRTALVPVADPIEVIPVEAQRIEPTVGSNQPIALGLSGIPQYDVELNCATGASTIVSSGAWRYMPLPIHPIVLWVNGVLRPLCG